MAVQDAQAVSKSINITIDMAKITCEQFLADEDGIEVMLIWIDGYMSALSENTEMSEEWMVKLGSYLGAYCTTFPKKTILDAVYAME